MNTAENNAATFPKVAGFPGVKDGETFQLAGIEFIKFPSVGGRTPVMTRDPVFRSRLKRTRACPWRARLRMRRLRVKRWRGRHRLGMAWAVKPSRKIGAKLIPLPPTAHTDSTASIKQ